MILYLNKGTTNVDWGAENFINKELKDLDVQTISLDYEAYKFRIAHEYESYGGILLNGTLVQRGTGYLIPTSVIKLLPKPRVLLLTELTDRVCNQSYMWDQSLFDYFLVRTPRCKKILTNHHQINQNKVEIFLSAYDDSTFFPMNVNKEIDILFVGNITPRRKKILDKLSSRFKEKLQIKNAYASELNKLHNKSRIVINIHGDEFLDTETRVFEALGSASFLITEKLSDESPFKDGEHLIEAESTEQMIELIRMYLDLRQDSTCEIIRENGYQLVTSAHLYRHRAVQLKDKFGSLARSSLKSKSGRLDFLIAKGQERILGVKEMITKPIINRYHQIRVKMSDK